MHKPTYLPTYPHNTSFNRTTTYRPSAKLPTCFWDYLICLFLQVLLHNAGIVIFTLFLNATTIKKLLEILGMSELSDYKKISMANAVNRLQENTAHTFKMLKADHFLADAHWSLAESVCRIENPYMGNVDEVR